MTTPHSVRPSASIVHQRSRQPGFALIIVLTLMAFLVLLFVTLTISIQVSNEVSQYNLKSTQARLNALYGVRVAMAQLQKFAGPDTRVTATADLARRSDGGSNISSGNDTSTFLPNGNYTYNTALDNASGLATNTPDPNGGTRYWTGVWGNAAPSYSFYQGNTTATVGTNSQYAMPTPVLLTWLVSGDENTTLALNPNSTTSDRIPATQFQINSITAAKPTFTPKNGFQANSTALTVNATALTNITIPTVTINGGPASAVLLVGTNSIGNSSIPYNLNATVTVSEQPMARYVAAPLVSLNEPGDEDTQPVTTGSYAYWVGDEGVKAKYNTVDSLNAQGFAENASVTAVTQNNFLAAGVVSGLPKSAGYLYHFMVPQQYGLEEMTNLKSYPSTNANLKSISEPLQAHYVDTTVSTLENLDPLRYHYFDYTTYAYGVLADSQRGGLKYDLTTAFEVPAVYSNDLTNGPGNGAKFILPQGSNNTNITGQFSQSGNVSWPDYNAPAVSPLAGPTWSAINTFYNVSTTVTNSTVNGAVAIQPGVAPVIVQGRMTIGILLDSSSQVDTSLNVGFVVANPYNYTITAKTGLDLRFTINTHTHSEWGLGIQVRHSNISNWSPSYPNNYDVALGYITFNASESFSNYYPLMRNMQDFPQQGTSNPSMFDNLDLHLSDTGVSGTPLTLLPGQAKLYSISGSHSSTAPVLATYETFASANLTYVGPIIASSGNRTIQLAASPTGSLYNYVLINTGGGVVPSADLPTGDGRLFLVELQPSVACTLQISSNGTLVQSIMDLDLTGDGVHGTAPNSPLESATFDQISNGTPYPHYVGSWYFWLGMPDTSGLSFNALYNNPTLFGLGSEPPLPLPTLDMSSGVYSPSTVSAVTGVNYRTYTDYNLRASNITLPPSAPLNPETINGSVVGNATANSGFPNIPPYLRVFDQGYGNSGNNDAVVISDDQFTNGSTLGTVSGTTYVPTWGRSNLSGSTQYAVLYNLPWRIIGSRTTTNDLPMLSLGQLESADLTADDIFNSVSYQPGNAFGNSFSTPFVPTTQSVLSITNNQTTNLKNLTASQLGGSSGGNYTLGSAAGNTTVNAYDISYLVNAALWDHYYFSGVAQGGINTEAITAGNSSTPSTISSFMSNPRLKFAAGFSPNYTVLNAGVTSNITINQGVDDLETETTTAHNYMPAGYALARYLLNEGAFNINSTSVEAWKAILGALRGLNPGTTGANITTDGNSSASVSNTVPVAAFPRVLPTLSYIGNSTLYANYGYNGTSSRAPNAGDSQQSYTGYRTLSDEDIDNLAVGIVQQVRARGPFLSVSQFVNRRLGPIPGSPANDDSVKKGALQSAIDAIPLLGGSGSFNTMTDLTGNTDSVTFTANASYVPNLPTLQRSTGIPGWLTQADVLQTLAPILSARSDTFVIRAYGQVNDPLDGSVESRAWCEAVVQRLPEYVDTVTINQHSTQSPAMPDNPAVMPWAANPQNNLFGRRFSLVSMRWLSPGDI